MGDVDEGYRLDRHCLSCNYVHLEDEGIAVPMDVYKEHYIGKGRYPTSGTCSFMCKLELLLNGLETEEDFNAVLGMSLARSEK